MGEGNAQADLSATYNLRGVPFAVALTMMTRPSGCRPTVDGSFRGIEGWEAALRVRFAEAYRSGWRANAENLPQRYRSMMRDRQLAMDESVADYPFN